MGLLIFVHLGKLVVDGLYLAIFLYLAILKAEIDFLIALLVILPLVCMASAPSQHNIINAILAILPLVFKVTIHFDDPKLGFVIGALVSGTLHLLMPVTSIFNFAILSYPYL